MQNCLQFILQLFILNWSMDTIRAQTATDATRVTYFALTSFQLADFALQYCNIADADKERFLRILVEGANNVFMYNWYLIKVKQVLYRYETSLLS